VAGGRAGGPGFLRRSVRGQERGTAIGRDLGLGARGDRDYGDNNSRRDDRADDDDPRLRLKQ